MRVVGKENKTFNFDDGKSVSGLYLYLTDQVPQVEGLRTERIFISNEKLLGLSPGLGDEVAVYFNRYGKVQSIALVDSLTKQ